MKVQCGAPLGVLLAPESYVPSYSHLLLGRLNIEITGTLFSINWLPSVTVDLSGSFLFLCVKFKILKLSFTFSPLSVFPEMLKISSVCALRLL